MTPTVYKFGTFELDTGARELREAGAAVACEPKAYEVLVYLAERPDRAVSKLELRDAIWPGETLSDGVLARTIWAARKAVRDDGEQQHVIRTVPRHGYRMVAPLVKVSEGGDSRADSEPPPATSASSPLPFVGRYVELAALDDLFRAAVAKTPRFAWVLGEAGIGKTRLIEEFAGLARRRGAEVLTGGVPQATGVPPYWIWRDAFEPWFRTRAREQLEADLGEGAALLADVFHVLRRRFPDLPFTPPLDSADEERFRLFSAMERFIVASAQLRPLVLILEDAQWADASSLHMLRSLSRLRSSARLLVLVSFRTGELRDGDARDRLRIDATAEPDVVALSLGGLDSMESALLSERVSGRPLTARWTSELALRTEGNPLMLIELARLLQEQGAFQGPPSKRSLPSGARSTIERRLDLMPERCIRTLMRAAVFGRSFRVDLTSRLDPSSTDDVLASLDEASACHLIEAEDTDRGTYRFRHPLLREVVYGRLLASERVQLHCLAGRLLEERYGHVDDPPLVALAHHFAQSPFEPDLAKAIDYATRAGDDAMRGLAYPEAVELYAQALAHLDRIAPGDFPRRARLLHQLGLAQLGAASPTDAMETFGRLIARARDAADWELFAQGAVGLEEARHTARAAATSSIPLLREAVQRLQGPTPLHGQALERLAAALTVINDPARLDVSRQAVEAARALGDPFALVRALSTRHLAIWGPDSLEERLAIGAELLALADRRLQKPTDFGVGAGIWCHGARLADLLELGDRDALLRTLAAATVDLGVPGSAESLAIARQIAENTRLAVHVENVRLLRASLFLLEGKFAEAEKLALEVAGVAARIQAGNVLTALQIHFFGLRYQQGRVAELVPVMRMLMARNPGFAYAGHAALALSMADLGRPDEGRAEIDALTRDAGLERLPRDSFWISTLTSLSEASFLLEDPRHAEELYALLEPFEARTALSTAAYCTGSIARYLGMLAMLRGRYAEAADHFEHALQHNGALQAAPFVALTQHAYALLRIRSRGSSAHATELLAAAASTATELGMAHLEQRIGVLRVSLES